MRHIQKPRWRSPLERVRHGYVGMDGGCAIDKLVRLSTVRQILENVRIFGRRQI